MKRAICSISLLACLLIVCKYSKLHLRQFVFDLSFKNDCPAHSNLLIISYHYLVFKEHCALRALIQYITFGRSCQAIFQGLELFSKPFLFFHFQRLVQYIIFAIYLSSDFFKFFKNLSRSKTCNLFDISKSFLATCLVY